MENEFVYKRATVEDIADLVLSRLQVLKTVFHLNETANMEQIKEASLAYYKEALANETHTAYLVYDGESVIGAGGICYYEVMPMPYNTSGKRAYIMNMYTAEQYRRRGIAGKVLDLLLADAKQKGVLQVSLSATELGKPVYKKRGFFANKDAMLYEAY